MNHQPKKDKMQNHHRLYVSTTPMAALEDRKQAYRTRLELRASIYAGDGGLTEADRAAVIPVVMRLQGMIMFAGAGMQEGTMHAIDELKAVAIAGLAREREAAADGSPSSDWRQQKYAELLAYLAVTQVQGRDDTVGRVAFQLGLFMTRWICDRAPAEDLAILHDGA